MTTRPSRRDLITARFSDQKYQIASLLVQARPENIPGLTIQLNTLTGIEVHDSDARGRMILTVEAENDYGLLGAITKVENTKGVITTSLVYHQIEEDDE
ncbi:MAG: chaperone NapD [Rhodospirillales bacterium]|nr:chaperone NapD [Rhodospirillales bacterium]